MKMQSRRPKEDPEINLISLIDIALLLVIFFMLTSTFMQEGRLKIELPQASLAPATKQKADPIVVTGVPHLEACPGKRAADGHAGRSPLLQPTCCVAIPA